MTARKNEMERLEIKRIVWKLLARVLPRRKLPYTIQITPMTVYPPIRGRLP